MVPSLNEVEMLAAPRTLFALGVLALGGSAAQAPLEPVPFKLGRFELEGRSFLGLVLDDRKVVELAAANAALAGRFAGAEALEIPSDMKTLIARYEQLRERLHAIARESVAAPQAPHVHGIETLRIRLPLADPEHILNAAVNYTEHAAEMQPGAPAASPPGTAPRPAPGLWQRRAGDQRHTPYLFIKPRSALIADGEAIQLPPGREQIDWECELAVVVGRPGAHVSIARAREHVFGYTIQNDVSDRGGRGDARHGSDWLLGKGHDTFAPLGPFIVPREFLPDPQRLRIRFTLSGTLMQDSSSERMTHGVDELLHYASNILTLQPGDIISTGSPAGVGSARNPPIFMKPGDRSVCSIEGIGTLSNPVRAAEER